MSSSAFFNGALSGAGIAIRNGLFLKMNLSQPIETLDNPDAGIFIIFAPDVKNTGRGVFVSAHRVCRSLALRTTIAPRAHSYFSLRTLLKNIRLRTDKFLLHSLLKYVNKI